MAVVKACDVKVNASVQNQSFVYKLETIIKWCSWSSIPTTPPPPDQLLIFLTQIVF